MNKNRVTTITFLLAICFAIPISSTAQDGSLDLTFGTNGIVFTSILNYTYNIAGSLAIQADGKIVVGGYSQNGNNPNPILIRYNTDGSLDATFGNAGIVLLNYPGLISSIAIQADGKIVAGGDKRTGNNSQSNFFLSRYNTDGSLDNTFGSAGIVETFIGVSSYCSKLAIQADGKILMRGNSNQGSQIVIALSRYNTDGS